MNPIKGKTQFKWPISETAPFKNNLCSYSKVLPFPAGFILANYRYKIKQNDSINHQLTPARQEPLCLFSS